jgi:hypothetical protein
MKPTPLRRLKLSVFFFFLLFGSASPLVAAPTAVTSGGTPDLLLGFDNIEVSGILYDVRFVDGTIASVFPGGLDFTSQADALAASNALRAAFDLFPFFDGTPKQRSGAATSLLATS